MASQGERLRMQRSISHTIFWRSGTNNSPRWCIMFGFEWPLPWYVQTAFWSAEAGTGNVPAVLLSLTGTPWTTGVPGRSNRSLTGPYWSSMLLLYLLASCAPCPLCMATTPLLQWSCDALSTVPSDPHGHQNGQQISCIWFCCWLFVMHNRG